MKNIKNNIREYCTYYVIIALFSIFVSCSIEKFFYSLVPFEIKRALIVTSTIFVLVNILITLLGNTFKNKVLQLCQKIYKLLCNKYILMHLKIFFSMFLLIYITIFYCQIYYMVYGIIELLIIYVSTRLLYKRKMMAYFFNSILLFLYNINLLILIFSSSFLNLIMIENIGSLGALKGKLCLYLFSVILVIIFSFIPVYFKKPENKYNIKLLLITIIYEVFLLIIIGSNYSVIGNYVKFMRSSINHIVLKINIKTNNYDKKIFYNEEIEDYYTANNNKFKNPNIILIFTEGLSQHIIYDPRNIMPNLKKLSEESISFDNYYCHTAATFRALQSQLYSGYQLGSYDQNNLISIHSIL